MQRYERERPGELLHIDIKKLGRFDRIGHRITGDYSQRGRGLGWEYVFVAIDDHSRIAFTQVYPDEKQASAVAFLRAAEQYYAGLRVRIERVLTDNGPAFHSAAFGQACQVLGIAQKFTRAYRPQTNGKAERFIQSALRARAPGLKDDFVGDELRIPEALPPGEVCRMEIRGSTWQVRNTGSVLIPAGGKARVTAVAGIGLHVEASQ